MEHLQGWADQSGERKRNRTRLEVSEVAASRLGVKGVTGSFRRCHPSSLKFETGTQEPPSFKSSKKLRFEFQDFPNLPEALQNRLVWSSSLRVETLRVKPVMKKTLPNLASHASVSHPFLVPTLHPDAAAAAKSLQSCPTLCDPIDGSPPGSPVPGILQARTLE